MTVKVKLRTAIIFCGSLYLYYLLIYQLHYAQGVIFLSLWLGFGLALQMLFKNQPDLMRERSQPGPNVPSWDRFLVLLYQLLSGVMLAVSAWDAAYARLSPEFSPAVYAGAYSALFAGLGVSVWAMRANNFFSSMVRIQEERNHRVVSAGPYQWLRHPGYAGSLVINLMIPVVLGSLWGLVPAALLTVVLWARTAKEDAYLQMNLTGYAQYARQVRWRLVPGIW